MNKSVALFNLKLPPDILNSICEFIYYTYDDCVKNRKEKIKNINNIIIADTYVLVNEYYNQYKTSICSIEANIQLQIIICKTCGNFKMTNDSTIHKNCICFCHNDDDIVYTQLDENTYTVAYI